MMLLLKLKQLLRNPWAFGLCSLGTFYFMILLGASIENFCGNISFIKEILTAFSLFIFVFPIIPGFFYAKVYQRELSFLDAMKIPGVYFLVFNVPLIFRESGAFKQGELTGDIIGQVIVCAVCLKIVNKICLWYCNKKEKSVEISPSV